MKHHGWRKPTPDLGVAQMHAQAGEQTTIPKNQAFLACKRVAAYIGLKPGDIMLLDTLGAFSKPQDWETGRQPIVWPSNAYLMDQTGYSRSALKRHVRRLIEAGVITVKDSSNGKRWGHRDASGYIIDAFGFDLAPLALRAAEFGELFDTLQAECQLRKRLKHQITITRRSIRAIIEAQPTTSELKTLTETFEDLLQKLPKRAVSSSQLDELLRLFTRLESKVHNHVNSLKQETDHTVQACTETNPMGSNNTPHIQSTIQHSYVERNAKPQKNDTRSRSIQSQKNDNKTTQDRPGLSLSHILKACPDLLRFLRDLQTPVRDWKDLHRGVTQVCPMIGITDHTWSNAKENLGIDSASAAVALIFDKFSKGEIVTPGAYLRGLIERARVGQLHLERSLYGRLARLNV